MTTMIQKDRPTEITRGEKQPAVIDKVRPGLMGEPYGDTIIVFVFEGKAALGTSPLKPSGSYMFKSYKYNEVILDFGARASPFVEGSTVPTNSALTIHANASGVYPYKLRAGELLERKYTISFGDHGVDKGELRVNDELGRACLIRTGAGRVFFKDAIDSGVQLVVFNTFDPIMLHNDPGTEDLYADLAPGFYRAFFKSTLDAEAGGSDEADIFILPP